MSRSPGQPATSDPSRPEPDRSPPTVAHVRWVLRVLRWAWLAPLALLLLLDLATSDEAASGWQVCFVSLGTVAAVVGIGASLRLFRTPVVGREVGTEASTALAAGFAVAGAVVAAFTSAPVVVSSALVYALMVLLGVRLADARGMRDLGLAAAVVLAAVVQPLPVHGDGLFLASLTLTVVVISAALGLVVREQRRGVVLARQLAAAGERRSMASELHDTVAHEITGIVVLAQAARLPATSGAAASPQDRSIALIEQAAGRALEQVRELVETLRTRDTPPAAADHPGGPAQLAPAGTGSRPLTELIDAFAASGPARVVVDVRPVDLSTSGWLAAQRICAEALTNIRRHAADAREVRIGLVSQGSGVLLSVLDDGRSGHGIGGGSGSGLAGARERAELLGGALESGRTSDGSWRVAAYLPTEASVRRDRDAR